MTKRCDPRTWRPGIVSSHCKDCGIDVGAHWYMLRDKVWLAAGMGLNWGDGCLCLWCLEKRLGRNLVFEDFKRVPAGAAGWYGGRMAPSIWRKFVRDRAQQKRVECQKRSDNIDGDKTSQAKT